MKKTLLGLTAMTLFFAACKKDDDSPETYYLSQMIEVYEDGNDTTFITYNADNTFKELSYSYISNDQLVTYAEGPVYEGGKIVSIQEKRNGGAAETKRSFVYTAGVVSRIIYSGDDNGDGMPDVGRYDSLVYAAGKLAELHQLYESGNASKFILTWEGNNVKTCSTYYKSPGADYGLSSVSKYTYDNKPGIQALFTGNYQWLNSVTNFEYLSANNLTKKEFFSGDVLHSTTTNVYTYEGNLLKMVESEDTNVDPPTTDTYTVKLAYTIR